MIGHQLGEPVDLAIAHLKHAAGVLEHRARLQLSEGDDLRHLVAAIFFLDVADHLAASRFAEIDVEVGHRHALGIEETFEQQPQPNRVEIGDRQRPGNDRPRAGSATRTDRNPVVLRPFDEVGDDQEIAGEAHLDDDVELELQPVAIDLGPRAVRVGALAPRDLGQPPGEPFARIVAQLLRLAGAVAGQAGQDRPALRRDRRTALRDVQRHVDRLGQVAEQRAHHRRGFHPRVRRAARAVLGRDIGRSGDAQHRVMRLVERVVGEAARVGRDQRQIAIIGEIDKRGFGGLLHCIAAPRELDIKASGEKRFQPVGIAACMVMLAVGEHPGQRALARPGQRNQPVGAPGERVDRHIGRMLDRAVEMRHRHQRAEIGIADIVLRIECQPVEHRLELAFMARPDDREEYAGDRLNPLRLARIGKGHGRIETVAVDQRDRRKAERARLLGDRLGLDRALQHGVGGKDAQRHETGMGHDASLGCQRRFQKPSPRFSCG